MHGRRLVLANLLCVMGLMFAFVVVASGDEVHVKMHENGVASLFVPAQANAWPPRLGPQAMFSVELSAHAVEWLHVQPKEAGIDELSRPDPPGLAVFGALEIPGAEEDAGGVDLAYEGKISLQDTAMTASYAVRPDAPVTICGLQLSAYLDAAAYQGATIRLVDVKTPSAGFEQETWYTLPDDPVEPEEAAQEEGAEPQDKPKTDEEEEVDEPAVGLPEPFEPGEEAKTTAEAPTPPFTDAEPVTIKLPVNANEDDWQLWAGFCKTIQVTGPENLSFTITAPKPYRFVIQDNRKWGMPAFEIRVAFVMNQEGLEVTDEDEFLSRLKFTFEDTVKFAPEE